jgi:polyhydroxyalkanoate synthase
MSPVALVKTREPEALQESKSVAKVPAVRESTPSVPVMGIDRVVHATIAQATAGLSPAALAGAFFDWTMHGVLSPDKQFEIAHQAIEGATRNISFAAQAASIAVRDPCEHALPHDNRFRESAWQAFPFNIYAHNFLSVERWWEAAMTNVRGVSQRHGAMGTFIARQIPDTVAPSNFVATNPQVIERTRTESGVNLIRGLSNWIADATRARTGAPAVGSEAFKVGEAVAVTPGKVVHRTRLAEIIQYAPATDTVRPEPIVIVPAWIMKYYILDLSPANSLVKFLTERGFTVFMISWKNPGKEDRNVDFDDYRSLGVLAATDAATAITGSRKVHAVGYCLGGTLLAIVAAAMARDRDDRLASLSFFAAQADFTEAGELTLFINESQIAFLEDMMSERGYLDAKQMAGAFQMLRSNDLIWSQSIQEYLMGERSTPIDIMAWSTDTTCMPYRMQSQYLRSLFLKNELAEGRFKVAGRPVVLRDIGLPVFVVATEQDHIAPWHSVFKFHLLTDTETTFALTDGGHNAGILSEPGHHHRHFRVATRQRGEPYVDPHTWQNNHEPRDGSWWPAWSEWLAERSGEQVAPPPLGNAHAGYAATDDAPGRYVFMR